MKIAHARLSRRSRAAATLAGAVVMVASVVFVQTRVSAAPVVIAQTCAIDAAKTTEFGSTTISAPIKDQVTSLSLPLSLPGDITATATVAPGGVIHTTGTMNLDVQALAQDILINQVKPGIAANPSGGTAVSNTAFLNLTLDNLTARFPVPSQIASTSNLTVSSTGVGATGAVNSGNIEISLAQIRAGAYQRNPATPGNSTTSTSLPPLAPFSVTLDIDATVDPSTPVGTTIVLHPGPVTFNLTFEVGVYFFGALINGGVVGPESCTPDNVDQVLASTAVVGAGTTTSSSTSTSTSTTTVPTSTSTSTSTSTTTAPTTTSTTTAPTTTSSSTTSTSTSTSTTSTSTTSTSTSTSTTSTTTAPTTTSTTTAPTTTSSSTTSTSTAPTSTSTSTSTSTTTTTAPTTTTTAAPTTTTTAAPTTTTTAAPTTSSSSTSTSSSSTTTTTAAPCPLTVSPTTIPQGGTFTLTSECWQPGATIQVQLNSTPVSLGSLVADSLGKVSGTFTVPTDFPTGAHTVSLTGTSIAGQVGFVRSANVTIAALVSQATTTLAPTTVPTTVQTFSTLPVTGSDSTVFVGYGLLLLGTGGAIVAVSRRRRRD